ncbi:hypothetical protein F2Q70_00003397 [Brassica cretica]|uniref:SGS domain-containing protein n=1 Tax=Brassica cretica TaxID=69181 RepID=A0A8S9IME7_BRACR|nr:hypothetical protein F2Q70_00003397 [Brassica cretica]
MFFVRLAQGRTLGSLAYLPNAKLGSVLQVGMKNVCIDLGFEDQPDTVTFFEEDRRRLHRLRCSVKDYAWGKIGSDSLVYRVYAVNSDGQIDSTRPYAELWMGTHESGPSYLEDDADGVTLRSWIAENPEALGDRVLDKWGCDLSFLFKSLERQLCSNEVMVRHELGQRISQTAMSDVLRETENKKKIDSMASELAEKAKEAFLEDDFDVAVDLYSRAIDLDPNCAAFFADRAQANIKILNFTEAVADANKAIELEPTLSKAYLRKGTACMKLEEYSTAKAALQKGASVAPNESKFNKLIDECNLHIAEEEKDLAQQMPPTLPSSSTTPPLATAAPAKPMFRHEFYQKPEEVVVTVFAKGIPKQNVNVEFGDQILSVVIDVAGEEAYHFQPRLFGKVNSLSDQPVYPSSKPAKDWDKLEAEVKKQEKDEKLDGDAAMNKFFSDIYQSADEDMRRAMNKSFAESNGTVLSTNWKEVGTKKVESTPPDGMELKKWEY